ncbi:MAG: hypothetical protein IMZ71_05500, partial [Chloroflexi bacterium]|nr:hypothetical protein [Chloroflexota bacterium]
MKKIKTTVTDLQGKAMEGYALVKGYGNVANLIRQATVHLMTQYPLTPKQEQKLAQEQEDVKRCAEVGSSPLAVQLGG